MDGETFRELVGNRRRGLGPALLRFGLQLLEYPYVAVTAIRNRLYDRGIFRQHRVPLPVVSVGNLTLGGTGKSPLVAWLGRYFLEQGHRPGLISRGYGSAEDGVNDEFLELAFRLPEVPHLLNRDRVAAATEFLEQPGERAVDLLILDDAFQHRRMARDLDIVLLDASEPFGFEHVFPRGTLRESLGGLRRAQVALLSRADLVSPEQRNDIQRRVRALAPEILWGEVVHRPDMLLDANRQVHDLAVLRNRRIFAFCGIGNPAAFRKTLEAAGGEIVGFSSKPDHYRYQPEDLDALRCEAEALRAELLLCTVKDLVKLDRFPMPEIPLRALSISIDFLSGEEDFRRCLENTLTMPSEFKLDGDGAVR